jgi:hypothetical protein
MSDKVALFSSISICDIFPAEIGGVEKFTVRYG